MSKNKKRLILYIVLVVIFTVTFTIGVFGNPHFDIHDFCMNMASEFLGLIIAITLIEGYIRLKRPDGQDGKDEDDNKNDGE